MLLPSPRGSLHSDSISGNRRRLESGGAPAAWGKQTLVKQSALSCYSMADAHVRDRHRVDKKDAIAEAIADRFAELVATLEGVGFRGSAILSGLETAAGRLRERIEQDRDAGKNIPPAT